VVWEEGHCEEAPYPDYASMRKPHESGL